MKTLKMLICITASLILSLSGCSEQSTAPEASGGETSVSVFDSNSLTDGSVVKDYKTKFWINPRVSYVFNSSNTNLKVMRTIDLDYTAATGSSKNFVPCSDVKIYSLNSINEPGISCHSRGFELDEIIIENLTSTPLLAELRFTDLKRR